MKTTSTILELSGAGLVVCGVAMASVPLALIIGGFVVVVCGYTLGGKR